MTEKTRAALIRLIFGESRDPPKRGRTCFEALVDLIDDEISNAIDEQFAEVVARKREGLRADPSNFILKEKRK